MSHDTIGTLLSRCADVFDCKLERLPVASAFALVRGQVENDSLVVIDGSRFHQGGHGDGTVCNSVRWRAV